jgi:hypothetical protein
MPLLHRIATKAPDQPSLKRLRCGLAGATFGCKRSREIQKHAQDSNLSSPSHYPQDEQKHVQEVQVKLQSSDDPDPLYNQRVSM